MLGDHLAAGEHGFAAQFLTSLDVIEVSAGRQPHDLLERRRQVGVLHSVWRFDYLADLGSARSRYYNTISTGQFESGGIEMINLDAAAKDDAYDIGH
jgi:hypothetical protein